MPNYRRYYVPGGTYFFTVVTNGRREFLCDELGRRCLHNAIDKIKKQWPFELVAIVLLPDHLHAVWTLPPDDVRYSIRWKRIKEEFTRRYLESGGVEPPPSVSRDRHGECGIWQRRFWEHTVDDEVGTRRSTVM